MKPRTLLLSLLIAAPFAAAGNLECNPEPVKQGVPTVYRCVYHNGSLAQAYAALRTNQNETRALMLDHPSLPHTLPARSFTRRVQLRDHNGSDNYPAEISLRRQGQNRVLVKYSDQAEVTPYSRGTLFRRQGRNVEITITEIAP
ncbi:MULTISPECIES: hypothetical protein [Eikenella]|uniref:Uncharacterized protein n=1 Tax=Eikenella longinqua TaxID=1795827 RepID=A0A1A9S2D1_9NEIS|nr:MULTISPECIES: hypothetical protein [Eikenella]OAM31216.1 hypothetical protein A7P95_01615 [Eikenella longinqua]